MTCPLFNDYTRDCLKVFPTLISSDSLTLCTSEKYEENCVFFRIITQKEPICEFAIGLSKCPLVDMVNAEQFDELAKAYCLSQNKKACKRYSLKKEGKDVPASLLPNGSHVEENSLNPV